MPTQQKHIEASTDYAIRILPGDDELSTQELKKRSIQFARLLKGRNITRAVFLIERRIECAELMLGAHWADTNFLIMGDEHVETGLRVSADTFIEMIKEVDPQMLIMSDAYKDTADEITKGLPRGIHQLMIGDEHRGWESYEVLRNGQSSAPIENPGYGEPFALTGGSTGRSKIIKAQKRLDGKPYPLQEIMTPGKDGIVLVAKSLFGNLGLRAMWAGLLGDARIIILKEWDEQLFLQTVQDLKVTHTSLVPTQMSLLLEIPADERATYDLSSLQQVLHGGAFCPDRIKRAFIDWFDARLIEVYGTTERFGGTMITSDEWLKHPGSSGKAFVGFHVSIRDEAGRQLPVGEKGIIWFQEAAAHTRMEYLGNPDATAVCFNEYDEGTVEDVGYLDPEGYLYVTGRAKRMVIISGANIYPEAIEKVLTGHPDVRDAWIFGRPDETMGEKLYGLVQARPESEVAPGLANRLLAVCEEKLGTLMTPAALQFVDRLPRNTESGKMDAQQIASLEARLKTASTS
jgi:long-chain acyl-CoA synthetase